MATSSGLWISRPVRPGETPEPLSVWQWRSTGQPRIALGLRHLKGHYVLVSMDPYSLHIDDTALWTAKALVGMGPVLPEWYCLEEAPAIVGVNPVTGSFKVTAAGRAALEETLARLRPAEKA